jgi:glycosyltransferase involved in cell wall biosynthesis
MRILHIVNNLATGGAQSVLLQLLSSWSESGDEAHVVALASANRVAAGAAGLGVPMESLDLRKDRLEPAKFLRLVRTIRRYQPDVVQTWLYHSDLLGGLAATLAGRIPVVWGIHHTTDGPASVQPGTWRVVQILARLSGSIPARIVCCSESARRTHAALGYCPGKLAVIHNGVDTQRFHPDPSHRSAVRAELGLPADAKLVGMFARYHPQKDHETLMRGAARLFEHTPHVHFVLAGEGIGFESGALQRLLSTAGVAANFHLLGNRDDMPRLHAAMDIVTLTSAYGEALPLTLAEAMSCGVPCVATDVGDTSWLIGEAGAVVPPRQPAALAKAWQAFLKLPPEAYNRFAQKARERALTHMDPADMVHQYRSLYLQVAAGA